MNDSDHTLRRILVALDGSRPSEAALDVAAQFAVLFNASLHGVFVEDEQLKRLARLPFHQEVRPLRRTAVPMSGPRLQRQLRAQAEAARRMLEDTARALRIEHSFAVRKGHVVGELLDAAADTDLVTLGKTSSAQSSRQRLGRTTTALLERAPAAVLILRDHGDHAPPVVTYFDGSAAARAALRMAARLAHLMGHVPLKVLLPPGAPDETATLREAVHDVYGEQRLLLDVHVLSRLEASRLPAVLHHAGGFAVLPDTLPQLRNRQRQLLYELDRPVLIMRAPTSAPATDPS
ncbi:universal stress protein [Salisaeta longa]|uniref:universal stress protein n=1 Tax=Salisaeta longa TaxID=503170 RepID=UPI0003B48898|nr:universal stress protein [Salisaeta longa]